MTEEHVNLLTREELVLLLEEVGALLLARGLEGQLHIVGGAAMALVFDARRVTRDVDAVAPGDQAPLLPGLRVTVASPEHLIAMKLRALRDRDLADLEVLFRIVGIRTPQDAADIHHRLFEESYIGSTDPEEALYAAQLVFDRARAAGRPIG